MEKQNHFVADLNASSGGALPLSVGRCPQDGNKKFPQKKFTQKEFRARLDDYTKRRGVESKNREWKKNRMGLSTS